MLLHLVIWNCASLLKLYCVPFTDFFVLECNQMPPLIYIQSKREVNIDRFLLILSHVNGKFNSKRDWLCCIKKFINSGKSNLRSIPEN